MNQHVRKLALKCGAWHQVYGDQLFMHDHNFDIDKFAELIVQECANRLSELGNPELGKGIMKHFRVGP
jgi:hypothetical protein